MIVAPPFAHELPFRMKTQGRYDGGGPKGVVVHFTAGHDGAENTMRDGLKQGFAYWCIQRDGKLYAAHDADRWGWHCGESKWTRGPRKLIGSANDDLLGIEINAGGRLENKGGKLFTWFGKQIPASEARYCDGSSPDQCEGWYHVYTKEQEETLALTILWLARAFPKTFSLDLVLGHCEISGKLGLGFWRKNDPSAALSMTMPAFREMLKARAAAAH